MRGFMAGVAVAALAAGATVADVFPTNGHAASNFIPFGSGTTTMHQVFDAGLFSSQTGGLPAQISSIGFAPGLNGTFDLGQVDIFLGYTNRVPGQGSGSGGLSIPDPGTSGTPNVVGATSMFFSNPNTSFTINNFGSNNFSEMVFNGNFIFDPNLGNLLVVIDVPSPNATTLHVSRATGSAEASRAYRTGRFGDGESPGTATRMDFTFRTVPAPGALALLGIAGFAAKRRRR